MTAQLFIEEMAVGKVIGPINFGPVTLRMLVEWAAASRDFRRIHYDKEHALEQGLPDVVVHGPIKMALMGRILMALAGPHGWVRRMNCRYLGLDLPQTVLTVRATVTAVRLDQGEADVELEVVNEKEARTAAGSATVNLPRRG